MTRRSHSDALSSLAYIQGANPGYISRSSADDPTESHILIESPHFTMYTLELQGRLLSTRLQSVRTFIYLQTYPFLLRPFLDSDDGQLYRRDE